MTDQHGKNHGALWDRKYEAGLPSLTRPDPFFVSAYQRFISAGFPRGGSGLDLAGGLGRHALWLAQRQWRMCVVDVSEVAISKLREEAGRLGVTLDVFVVDAADFDWAPAAYDLVVLFYHFDRRLFPRIVSALKPGGFLVSKLAVPGGSGTAAPGAGNVLRRSEIVDLVSGLHVLDHQERPVRDRGVVELVGQKPPPTTAALTRTPAS